MFLKTPPWLLCLASIASAASAASVTTTVAPSRVLHVRAHIPTGPGEIGINPVEDDIGDAAIFVGTIASSDTVYVQDYHVQTVVSISIQINTFIKSLSLTN